MTGARLGLGRCMPGSGQAHVHRRELGASMLMPGETVDPLSNGQDSPKALWKFLLKHCHYRKVTLYTVDWTKMNVR